MPSVWLADIRLAVQHLREMSGVRRVVLVGARLGGLLAACAEARSVSRLVLWDPVTSGRELVAELQQYAEGDAREWEVQGFPVTAPVRRELEALDLGSVKRVPPEVRLVVSQASTGLAHLQADLEARRARVETAHIDAPAAWLEDGDFGAGAVPVPVLRQIVTWVQ
jgi:pimeloyl-ACP methyl ester carboxylesterase